MIFSILKIKVRPITMKSYESMYFTPLDYNLGFKILNSIELISSAYC